ncbi:hypothetical protein GCM10022284_10770 [Streptomyces hundungensis]
MASGQAGTPRFRPPKERAQDHLVTASAFLASAFRAAPFAERPSFRGEPVADAPCASCLKCSPRPSTEWPTSTSVGDFLRISFRCSTFAGDSRPLENHKLTTEIDHEENQK